MADEIKAPGVSKIDDDVLECMSKDLLLDTLKDQSLMNRAILNAFAESLSELKALTKGIDDLNNTLTICGSKKIAEFFKEMQVNVKHEEAVQKTYNKVKQSHKKPQKA